jgi:hypothetical protein
LWLQLKEIFGKRNVEERHHTYGIEEKAEAASPQIDSYRKSLGNVGM